MGLTNLPCPSFDRWMIWTFFLMVDLTLYVLTVNSLSKTVLKPASSLLILQGESHSMWFQHIPHVVWFDHWAKTCYPTSQTLRAASFLTRNPGPTRWDATRQVPCWGCKPRGQLVFSSPFICKSGFAQESWSQSQLRLYTQVKDNRWCQVEQIGGKGKIIAAMIIMIMIVVIIGLNKSFEGV